MAWLIIWAQITQNLFFKAPDPKVKVFFKTRWFYWIQLMIHEKMRSCLWKVKLGFLTYGLISVLGWRSPKLVFRLKTSRLKYFLKFDIFGFNLQLWTKSGLFLWKSELGFWTYGLLSDLGPSGPKLVFKLQTPMLTYFFKIWKFNWI